MLSISAKAIKQRRAYAHRSVQQEGATSLENFCTGTHYFIEEIATIDSGRSNLFSATLFIHNFHEDFF